MTDEIKVRRIKVCGVMLVPEIRDDGFGAIPTGATVSALVALILGGTREA
jgi:hypothetical protein